MEPKAGHAFEPDPKLPTRCIQCGAFHQPVSSIDHQQQRGMALDIIDEALADWQAWCLDDDYDAQGCLNRIMNRMCERRAGLPDPL